MSTSSNIQVQTLIDDIEYQRLLSIAEKYRQLKESLSSEQEGKFEKAQKVKKIFWLPSCFFASYYI
jgi:hypothetical protein